MPQAKTPKQGVASLAVAVPNQTTKGKLSADGHLRPNEAQARSASLMRPVTVNVTALAARQPGLPLVIR